MLPAGASPFVVEAAGGSLSGWIAGSGPRVLLLHGGPGLGFRYMDDAAADIGPGYEIASYQQRGLAPSTLEGPFSVAQEVADVAAVLDGLGWADALIVGHSWGGHLALRVGAAHPARARGVLAIDAIGVVGDGGRAAFVAELIGRVPTPARERLAELEALEADQRLSLAEDDEAQDIMWPAYFADPATAPPRPPLPFSVEAFEGVTSGMEQGLDEVAAALATGAVPMTLLAGGSSPVPWGQASRATANLSQAAEVDLIPHAGHFVWQEAPGSVRAALQRLVQRVARNA